MRQLAVLGLVILLDIDATSRAPLTIDAVVPNDNRVPGGTLRDGVRELRLEARPAAWRPDLNVDSAATVLAFAEEGGAPRIPGPLLRVRSGAEVRVTVRNSLPDSTLVVHGLRAGTIANDSITIAPRTTREIRFRAGAPGTYLYWGSTSRMPIDLRRLRDSQLTGAVVVDPPDAKPDPPERILVMTVLDVFPDDSVYNKAKEDMWELAINGRSWPHNERVEYAVGDTVRWRWLNGSYLPHPMHLHGFHFRVLSRGSGVRDSTFATNDAPLAVTEFMTSGSTFSMAWVPTRAGSWLMHCHMIPHITPFPARADTTRAHDGHDVRQHALSAMAGLVLGITTVDRRASSTPVRAPAERLRLFAQRARADSGKPNAYGYVLQRGAEPRVDSVTVPGAPLILTRGVTSAITVINRLPEPTTVHWHGMELESVYDGVSGWSRTGSNVAPLIAAGDSFTVAFTPPRAGTFIYHTHMDEGAQLGGGMYGPLLVLEPGERHDPATDLAFVIGDAVEGGKRSAAINGHQKPAPTTLRSGVRHRLRLINILAADGVRVRLVADSTLVEWRPLAKDGADLPNALRRPQPASLRRFGVGETYDFEWTPARPMDAVLEFEIGSGTLRQSLLVRP